MKEITLAEHTEAAGKRIVDLSLPASINILAIKRGDVYISPIGSTKLLPNDILHVLAEDKNTIEVFEQELRTSTELKK
jgi:Trk K+ transport system NAD-binding subunit